MNQKHRMCQTCGINHDLRKSIQLREWAILPQYGVSSTTVALLPGHWPSWRDSRALSLVSEGFRRKSKCTHTYECIQRVIVSRVYEWITNVDSTVSPELIMPCKSTKHEKWIRCLDCTMSKKMNHSAWKYQHVEMNQGLRKFQIQRMNQYGNEYHTYRMNHVL